MKRLTLRGAMLFLLLTISISLVLGTNKPLLYTLDPVAPEHGNVELKGSLKVDLFTGTSQAEYYYSGGRPHATSKVVYY